ncbi:uncharacterized protein PITG_08829 [Phytophthora infestans T30-4]|uniref:Uncharacterized protein n=1 Tax=Phytophthora infestans (strain T30-4) TaxID=403677 RepID=D0NDA2_PHYIT|nr:uncharacterized protein PITG_08829 [Phytophthora infestans T30-4]EEY56059.1 hypothetical protein PITG_08829 [Phytophthora infestans T30-4]|eukprot:XP_002902889.1 hypothetical protein PITG_08829 [Phytophthora infestans T30-4]
MDAHGSDLPSIHQRPYFDGIVQLPVLPSHLARESLAAMPSSTYWPRPPRPSATPDSAPNSTEWDQTIPVSTATTNPSTPVSTTVNEKRKAGAKSSAEQQGKKKKSSKKGTTPSKRFVGTNKMIEALLDMHFKDDDVRLRVKNADTNRKKALAWQFFANRLSEKLEVVLSSDQPPKSGYTPCKSGCRHERRHNSYRRIDGADDKLVEVLRDTQPEYNKNKIESHDPLRPAYSPQGVVFATIPAFVLRRSSKSHRGAIHCANDVRKACDSLKSIETPNSFPLRNSSEN